MKQSLLLLFIFTSFLAFSQPAQLLQNGSFKASFGKKLPDKWGELTFRQKETRPRIVVNHAALGGKSGIELPPLPAEREANAFVGVGQGHGIPELKSPRTLVIRALLASSSLEKGSIVVYCNDKDKKTIYWKTIAHYQGTMAGHNVEAIAELPVGTVYFNISFRNNGNGSIWFTDAAAYWQDELKSSNAESIPPTTSSDGNLIANPQMTPSKDVINHPLPEKWDAFFYHGKEAEGTAICKKGVCTLTHVGGAFGFGVMTQLLGSISEKHLYQISAQYKVSSGGKFQISAEFLDEKGTSLGEQLSPEYTSTTESEATWSAKAPPEASILLLRWLNSGKGVVDFRLPCCKMGESVEIAERFPIRLRIIPADATPDWAGGKPCFYTFKTVPMPLSIKLAGEVKKLKNPALYIEIPDVLEFSCYSSYPSLPYYADMKGEAVKRENGRTLWKYTDIPLWNILYTWFGAQHTVIANICGPNAGDGPHTIRFWAENDGKADAVHTTEVRLLPDLKEVKLPKEFYMGRWSSLDTYAFDEAIFDKLTNALQLAGFRQVVTHWGNNPKILKYQEILRKKGWLVSYNYYDGSRNWKSGDAVPPPAVSPDGTQRKDHACPETIVDDPRWIAYFDKLMEDYGAELDKPGSIVAMDYEPFETMEWCFCDYCRKKFATRFKLKEVPSASLIRQNYKKEWTQFRCENTSKYLGLVTASLKRRHPTLKVYDYDYVVDYENPNGPYEKFSGVCKDPVLTDAFLDGHIQSYYHLFDYYGFRMMRINRHRFKSAYIPMGALDGVCEEYLNKDEVLSPARQRLMIHSAAVNGSNAYWFFSGIVDAIYMTEVQKTLSEIAILEQEPLWKQLRSKGDDANMQVEFRPYGSIKMADGKFLYTPDWKTLAASVRAIEGKMGIAAVFNFYEKPLFATLKAKMPQGKYAVEDILTREICFAGTEKELQGGVQLRLASRDVAFFRIRPANGDDAVASNRTAAMEKEFASMCAGNDNAWSALEKDGFSASPADLNQDGTPELLLKSPNGSAAIQLKDGAVIDWQMGTKKIDGQWGRTHIWIPASLNSGNYQWKLVSRSIKDKAISAVISATVAPVEMRKTFTMKANGSLDIQCELINNGTESMQMTVKLSHLLGKTQFFLPDGKELPLPAREDIITSPLGRHDRFADSLVRNVPLTTPSLWAKVNGIPVAMTLPEPERWMCYYSWEGATGQEATWEYIWLPVSVPPGKSASFPCSIYLK